MANGFSAVEKYEEKIRSSIVSDLPKKIKQKDKDRKHNDTCTHTAAIYIYIYNMYCNGCRSPIKKNRAKFTRQGVYIIILYTRVAAKLFFSPTDCCVKFNSI